ncbi:similar to Saccharomyces cerevisiae YLR071C RGR1 Subunit of the RNA polymerase II mediator complex [Maudiozyma saulgeensis]|uniref:Mediator of RNA polymerase II transcription subunit 14 n=1 Tax=Maudiozyma saulgeensis TaxID=1789683 RepID=A0A1X7R2Z7_9SACH|nr:similar to Saccharomyces cerevisiae YLR071C RGR1 Subunit of the RNA polymerase II mediator complex [Kazachstania saulgeensis]
MSSADVDSTGVMIGRDALTNGIHDPTTNDETITNVSTVESHSVNSEFTGNNINSTDTNTTTTGSKLHTVFHDGLAPEIPHVQINQTPLSMVIRNLTIFTIKEISQYMKMNLHRTNNGGPGNNNNNNGSSVKKVNFLQLVIYLRNQFLKLYVLIKWARTIKSNNFNALIDLLNWFRTTNTSVNNCIWALKASLDSMTNAKLPNADLITALEVLSLGRPNLPSHFLNITAAGGMSNRDNDSTVPPKVVLKVLRDLNFVVSIKMALMDLPPQFNDYYVKNGRVYISVTNEFEIQLSTIDRNSPFFFVDLNFLFRTEQSLPLNKARVEKLINDLLFKNKERKPLFLLYQFLHKYILTLKLYMIHIELQALENVGKFSGGNLIHIYDSKKSIISGRYWINGKIGNKGKFTIGVDKSTEKLILRWDNDFTSEAFRTSEDKLHQNGNEINQTETNINTTEKQDDNNNNHHTIHDKFNNMPIIYNHILGNVESILDEIMFNHANVIRMKLLSTGIFQEDEGNSDVLLFQLPTTCISTAPIQMKIDLITGVFYFKNPSPLLLEYIQQINRTEKTEDLIKILQKLKLDKITHVLRNMFEKTGWICSKVVKLDTLIPTQFKTQSHGSDLLQNDLFISLPKWPVNWYLILTVISSNSSCVIEKRIGKILSSKGKWELKYLDMSSIVSSKLETMTYQKIMSLQKTILHRIVNHMLIDSLNELKIKNQICSAESIAMNLPKYVTEDDSFDKDKNSTGIIGPQEDEYTSIITMELVSFLEGSNALNSILESSMFMRIDYTNSEIRLYTRFKRDIMIKQVQCEELLIHFVKDDNLAFYMCENFKSLGQIVHYLSTFRQKLMQLVILTDVVERLHKNFASDNFKIIALKPNEISFNYLKNNAPAMLQDKKDKRDCTINIITSDMKVKNLTVNLSKTNPQHIIQPFINNGSYDYHFIFNYLQFTSSLFTTLRDIINERQENKDNSYTKVSLGLHNLSEYQLVYHNAEVGTKITLIIELKNASHNGRNNIQFYVHFSNDEHITTKSAAYPMIHRVRNEIFILDTKANSSLTDPEPKTSPTSTEGVSTALRKFPHSIRLVDGISCDSRDIETILTEIHSILKVDSNEKSK